MKRCDEHGTIGVYRRGCRCDECRAENARLQRDYQAGRHGDRSVNRKLLREALQELFPMGLTDDCPARRGQR